MSPRMLSNLTYKLPSYLPDSVIAQIHLIRVIHVLSTSHDSQTRDLKITRFESVPRSPHTLKDVKTYAIELYKLCIQINLNSR